MYRISDHIEMAANEYLQETGKGELDALWLAEYFRDCVQDDFPGQDLVAFFALAQKALTLRIEKAQKLARLQQEKSRRSAEHKSKP